MKRSFLILVVTWLVFPVWANVLALSPEVNSFIQQMSHAHDYDKALLEKWFSKVPVNQTIIDKMNHPAESKPWHHYQKLFLTEQNIKNGVKFWQAHEESLAALEEQYGVPPEVIVGILGVETRYGKNMGNFSVFEALSTLAFHYPKRAPFFRKELEAFLLLVREQHLDPFALRGSYAGAMGIPQFMPSIYRTLAVSFDGVHKKDIWENEQDAMASVANYFKQHGWQPHQPVVVSASTFGEKYLQAPKDKKNPKTSLTVFQWIKQYDVSPSEEIPQLPIEELGKRPAALIELETLGEKEHWLGLTNFYVITRYNHSDHYAMAVHQLGNSIKKRLAEEGGPILQ